MNETLNLSNKKLTKNNLEVTLTKDQNMRMSCYSGKKQAILHKYTLEEKEGIS